MLAVVCPKCGRKFEAPDSLAGKRGKCGGCQAVLLIKAPEPPPTLVPPPPPPFFEGEVIDHREGVPEPPKPASAKPTTEPLPTPAPGSGVVVHVHQPKGGCGPLALEVVLTCCTMGVLGGTSAIATGKGPWSLLASIVIGIGLLIASAATLGALTPIWGLWVFFKLVFDLVRAAA